MLGWWSRETDLMSDSDATSDLTYRGPAMALVGCGRAGAAPSTVRLDDSATNCKLDALTRNLRARLLELSRNPLQLSTVIASPDESRLYTSGNAVDVRATVETFGGQLGIALSITGPTFNMRQVWAVKVTLSAFRQFIAARLCAVHRAVTTLPVQLDAPPGCPSFRDPRLQQLIAAIAKELALEWRFVDRPGGGCTLEVKCPQWHRPAPRSSSKLVKGPQPLNGANYSALVGLQPVTNDLFRTHERNEPTSKPGRDIMSHDQRSYDAAEPSSRGATAAAGEVTGNVRGFAMRLRRFLAQPFETRFALPLTEFNSNREFEAVRQYAEALEADSTVSGQRVKVRLECRSDLCRGVEFVKVMVSAGEQRSPRHLYRVVMQNRCVPTQVAPARATVDASASTLYDVVLERLKQRPGDRAGVVVSDEGWHLDHVRRVARAEMPMLGHRAHRPPPKPAADVEAAPQERGARRRAYVAPLNAAAWDAAAVHLMRSVAGQNRSQRCDAPASLGTRAAAAVKLPTPAVATFGEPVGTLRPAQALRKAAEFVERYELRAAWGAPDPAVESDATLSAAVNLCFAYRLRLAGTPWTLGVDLSDAHASDVHGEISGRLVDLTVAGVFVDASCALALVASCVSVEDGQHVPLPHPYIVLGSRGSVTDAALSGIEALLLRLLWFGDSVEATDGGPRCLSASQRWCYWPLAPESRPLILRGVVNVHLT
jgi:hypothetical protein